MTSRLKTEALDSLIGLKEQKQIIFSHAVVCVEDDIAFPSTLLIGNSGCGKTALARTICELCGVKFREIHARTIVQDKELLGATLRFLYNTKERTHLFIDEIHQLSMTQQELFFPVLDNHKVTIIAATTDTGRLVEPFQNRFRMRLTIQRYSDKECYEIADWYCKKKNIIATPNAVKRIAEFGRHTPRVIFSLVDSCYNKARFMAISSSKITGGDRDRMTVLTDGITSMTFSDLELYPHGIEKQEIAVLRALKSHGNVSLTTLCAITRIDQAQYLGFYEPHLLGLNFIVKSSRGRTLTKEGEGFLATVPEPKR